MLRIIETHHEGRKFQENRNRDLTCTWKKQNSLLPSCKLKSILQKSMIPAKTRKVFHSFLLLPCFLRRLENKFISPKYYTTSRNTISLQISIFITASLTPNTGFCLILKKSSIFLLKIE